jgi:hypothetical protein
VDEACAPTSAPLRRSSDGGGSGWHDAGNSRLWLVVADPGHLAGHPGWPLRNLLLMLAVQHRLRRVRVRDECCA